jgi:short-subunit dehydrogenase involved in D-alanine esterification of teichoic acids
MDIKIIGCVRNPAGSLLLTEVAEKYPNIVEIVKYVAADEANNQAIAQLLEEKYGHVDVLIPNAGMSPIIHTIPGNVLDMPMFSQVFLTTWGQLQSYR